MRNERHMAEKPHLHHLLAVDIGLHTGLALFREDGRLLWYRSHHIATPAKLKKLVGKLLRDTPRPDRLYLEGGGPLAEIWQREAVKLNIQTTVLHAQQWRARLLNERQQRSGVQAKREAGRLARQVIEQLGEKRPTSLRHDTAEAILVGLYAILQLGWLESWPSKQD